MKKSIKALLSILLALALLTPGILRTGDALAAKAGEMVEVSFGMQTNPGNAYMVKMVLEYDHEALKLVPNIIFEVDSYVAKFNEYLSAVFYVLDDARPGTYLVTVRVIEASDRNGDPVQFPTYSVAEITVERPPAEVPVYYIEAAGGVLLKTDTVMLPAGRTSAVEAETPEGWVVYGGQSIPVTVSEEGQAIPPIVTFWLVTPTPTPTTAPTPTATPSPTPLPGISLDITIKAGSNQLRWNRVPGAERCRVYRGTSGNGNYDLLATVTGESYTDSAVRGGTTYYYMVEALFPNGQTVTAKKSAVAATRTPKPTPKPVKAGEYVKFGHYPQTAAGNDSTEIEWLVLEVRGNEALLLSKYGLDAKPYNDKAESVTWETCSLRKWLNREFLNRAFTAEEQTYILRKNVDNSNSQGYSGYNTNGGNSIQDKVYLLSYAEVNKYLDVTKNISSMKSRVAPTGYAMKRGAWISGSSKTTDGTAAGWWWLRSPGSRQFSAAYVNCDGSLSYDFVNYGSGCVRPALWVNLESGIF